MPNFYLETFFLNKCPDYNLMKVKLEVISTRQIAMLVVIVKKHYHYASPRTQLKNGKRAKVSVYFIVVESRHKSIVASDSYLLL